VMLPPAPRALRPLTWAINKALRAATIATMPQWMRKMGGLRQSRVIDALITPVMRISFRVAALSPELGVVGLRVLSPSTVSAAGPALLGIPPRRPETVTPTQARERHGVLPPTEEYARFRQLVVARKAPAGPEIEESIAVLGPVA
jgi:hypothetical protein